MSIDATLARVSLLRQVLADPATLVSQKAALNGGIEAPPNEPAVTDTSSDSGGSPFAAALAQAAAGYAPTVPAGQPGSPSAYPGVVMQGIAGYPSTAPGGASGGRIVTIAETQLGQTEQPPGSNESPAIAQYRSATAGGVAGAPWCAYFASWVAQQAGEPLGPQGQGLGSVSEIWSWAQSSGRAIPNGPGVVPRPGDLIVFGDSHVGIVKEVLPSGQIATIEGNYENKVAANVRSPGEATGYVSMA